MKWEFTDIYAKIKSANNMHPGHHVQCLRTVITTQSHFVLQFINLHYTAPFPPTPKFSFAYFLLSLYLQFHYFMFFILKIKFKTINAKANSFRVQLGKQGR